MDGPLRGIADLLAAIEFQKNVFWLKISVCQAHLLVHELHTLETLLGYALDLLQAEAVVLVALDKFVKRFTQRFEHHAGVFVLVLPVSEVFVKQDKVVLVATFSANIIKDFDFNFSGRIVARDGADYFHSVVTLIFHRLAF